MKTLNLILIDDERRVRNTLRRALEECGDVRIIAEADTLESAREVLRKYPEADGIFLDIQFPGGTGFDLVQEIPDMQKVVFVTAYDQYALRAFEVNALDYIMKPASPERLQQSLRRLRAHAHHSSTQSSSLSSHDAATHAHAPSGIKTLHINDQLLLKFGTKSRFVPVHAIVFIRSADNYTEVHIADGSVALMRKALEEWSESLPADAFLRLHRSTLVHKRFIEEILFDGSRYAVRLRGIPELFSVSRSHASAVREALHSSFPH
ncbi:MAG: LytTR family DNA-binding domain-containing protein [Bacteroidota bacterium]|nr:LytTR family DNA-binding domain-containing protein [Bacteroidota bacterium]